MRVILASQSPRRKELLKLIVPNFDVVVSGIDEKVEDNLLPEEQAINISYNKAVEVFRKTTGDRIIIASDTMVVKDGNIYGKPSDYEDAKIMIKKLLQGDKSHYVITGLTVLIQKGDKYEEYKTFEKAKVYLKDMTDDEIQNWVNIGKCIDRAGAYGIQDEFCVFVEKIDGNYTTILGLPIHKVYDFIKQYIKL